MTHYRAGTRVEHLVRDDLTANGYEVVRAAQSRGTADLIAIKDGQVLLVNCKRRSTPTPAERAALLELAACLPGVGLPIVATKPTRRPIEYRVLRHSPPRFWRTWTPDEEAP